MPPHTVGGIVEVWQMARQASPEETHLANAQLTAA